MPQRIFRRLLFFCVYSSPIVIPQYPKKMQLSLLIRSATLGLAVAIPVTELDGRQQCDFFECANRCPQPTGFNTYPWQQCKDRCKKQCPPEQDLKCEWFGTAPFCEVFECPYGWSQHGRSVTGDGARCSTGLKINCCRLADPDEV